MIIKIGGLVAQFKKWFFTERAKIKAKAADLEAKLTKKNLSPLSPTTKANLKSKIDQLPPHPAHVAAVKSKLEEAIERWQCDRNAPNRLVVLASPSEPIEAILQATLAAGIEKISLIKCLSNSTRSPDGLNIKDKLARELELSKVQEQVLIAIPNLNWCFLRCVEGLAAIEHLQDLVISDRERFWLIGCNNWTWKYLDCVCNLSTGGDSYVVK